MRVALQGHFVPNISASRYRTGIAEGVLLEEILMEEGTKASGHGIMVVGFIGDSPVHELQRLRRGSNTEIVQLALLHAS